jgi:hypothetical protein
MHIERPKILLGVVLFVVLLLLFFSFTNARQKQIVIANGGNIEPPSWSESFGAWWDTFWSDPLGISKIFNP